MKSYISLLSISLCCLMITSCTSPMNKEVELLRAELAEAKAQLAEAQSPQAEFVHTVFFWLKEGVSEADLAAYKEGLESLRGIDVVKRGWIGPAAQTPREVVDNSYDMALILHFANAADQDTYQTHPTHLAFIEKSAHVWERVQVYDTLGE